MVLMHDCSCVLVKDESQLNTECSTTTFPDILQRLNEMRAHKEVCDVFFAVGKERKRFAAHRLILATSSDVFYRSFFGPLISRGLLDGYTEESATFIPDVLPEAFEVLLQFCYSAYSEVKNDLIVHILYAAEKYNVERLRNVCLRQLSIIEMKDCVQVLEQALGYEEMTIVNRCLKGIDENCDEIVISGGLRTCNGETLALIIGRDNFNPTSELRLFLEVLEFAKVQCKNRQLSFTGENLRNALGDILYLIRFPLMSVEDFDVAARQNVLAVEEVEELRQIIAGSQNARSHFVSFPRYLVGTFFILSQLEIHQEELGNHFILLEELQKSKKLIGCLSQLRFCKLIRQIKKKGTVPYDIKQLTSSCSFQVDRNVSIFCIGIYGYCDGCGKLMSDDVSLMFATYGQSTKRLKIKKLYHDGKITFLQLGESVPLKSEEKYYLCVNISNANGRWLYSNCSDIKYTAVKTRCDDTVTLRCDRTEGNRFFPELRFTI